MYQSSLSPIAHKKPPPPKADANSPKNEPQKPSKLDKIITKNLDDALKQRENIQFTPEERTKIAEYKQNVKRSQGRINLPNGHYRKEMLPDAVRQLTYRVLADMECEKIPTQEEIKQFQDCLMESTNSEAGNSVATISYNELMAMKAQLPKRVMVFLAPATFFRAYATKTHLLGICRLPLHLIVEYVSLKATFARRRIELAKYDWDGVGALTREQFMAYYRTEVMPAIDALKNLEETFAILYMNTVESMFFFFLDPKHTGRIRITDTIISDFLENVFSLQANQDYDLNWFAPEKTHEMNSLFQMYDSRRENFLTKEDFKRVQGGTFTSTFVERLFETHVHDGCQISYEEFIIFQIAFNHLAHPSALAYFFKILDVDEDGCLGLYELRYFYTELRFAYNGWFMEAAMPEFGDFADQFFDMVKPETNGKITLRELIDCKHGHDFVLCLISHNEFYRYETRDSENGNMLDQDSEMPDLPSLSDGSEPELPSEGDAEEEEAATDENEGNTSASDEQEEQHNLSAKF